MKVENVEHPCMHQRLYELKLESSNQATFLCSKTPTYSYMNQLSSSGAHLNQYFLLSGQKPNGFCPPRRILLRKGLIPRGFDKYTLHDEIHKAVEDTLWKSNTSPLYISLRKWTFSPLHHNVAVLLIQKYQSQSQLEHTSVLHRTILRAPDQLH